MNINYCYLIMIHKMQVGVTTISASNGRFLVRGGGADVRDLYIAGLLVAENCSEICYYGMMRDGLGYWWYQLPYTDDRANPYHLRCFRGSGPLPRNSLRLQFPSQFNTDTIDPAIPQMNQTDTKLCLCMFLNSFYVMHSSNLIF